MGKEVSLDVYDARGLFLRATIFFKDVLVFRDYMELNTCCYMSDILCSKK